MNHIERAAKVVCDYDLLRDTGPPGFNQAVLRELIVGALREVERELLQREARNENRTPQEKQCEA